MKPGTVILANVQQADGELKPRPMVILQIMPPFSDFLVAAFSSQLRHEVPDFDEIVTTDSEDFARSGLKFPSLIRLGLVSTIPASEYIGKLGSISNERTDRLRSRLADLIKP